MNESSSRSHAVFTVVLTACGKAGAGGRPERRPMSKLHLVDLAGSERNKKSEAAGARFKARNKAYGSRTMLQRVCCPFLTLRALADACAALHGSSAASQGSERT
jgi:hypothetical protein